MQSELAAEQDRQRQLQQDLSAVDEATLLSDDILDSNSGALQVQNQCSELNKQKAEMAKGWNLYCSLTSISWFSAGRSV